MFSKGEYKKYEVVLAKSQKIEEENSALLEKIDKLEEKIKILEQKIEELETYILENAQDNS